MDGILSADSNEAEELDTLNTSESPLPVEADFFLVQKN